MHHVWYGIFLLYERYLNRIPWKPMVGPCTSPNQPPFPAYLNRNVKLNHGVVPGGRLLPPLSQIYNVLGEGTWPETF